MRKSQFGLSPSTRDLVMELRQSTTLLTRWTGKSRSLELLLAIRDARESAAILDLIGLGAAGQIQGAARAVIRELVALIPVESLSVLDESLRSRSPYSSVWPVLRDKDVSALHAVSADDWAFVRLLASHPSGYVRASALSILDSDPSADSLPFLLLRLADWVDPVRALAESLVRKRLRPECAGAFGKCLPLLTRLTVSTRVRSEILEAVTQLLYSPECKETVLSGLQAESRIARREFFRIAFQNPAFSTIKTVEMAVADQDVLIRKWGYVTTIETLPAGWPRLREKCAADPYSPNRRLAFDSFVAEPNPELEQILPFLLDRSAAIRASCQKFVDRLAPRTAVNFYRNVISDAMNPATDIRVRGLAEVGDGSDAAVIARLVSIPSARTRRAVVLALRALRSDAEIDLQAMVASDVPSVAREAGLSLLVARLLPAHEIWILALKNPEWRVWLAILRILRDAGKWVRLQVYLEAVEVSDARISNVAVEELYRWLDRYNRSYTPPSSHDLVVMPKIFERVQGRLPFGLARELGFLVQSVLRP